MAERGLEVDLEKEREEEENKKEEEEKGDVKEERWVDVDWSWMAYRRMKYWWMIGVCNGSTSVTKSLPDVCLFFCFCV